MITIEIDYNDIGYSVQVDNGDIEYFPTFEELEKALTNGLKEALEN